MKKFIYLLAIASVAATVACSKTQLIQPPPEAEAISFRPLMNNMTKAADITAPLTPGFTVAANLYNGSTPFAGTTFFTEDLFTWDQTSEQYKSSTKHYWPASGTLDFFAFAFSGAAGQVSHTAGTKMFTVTPASAAADQTDLVIARKSNVSKTSSVALNFRHAESKVAIMLKNTAPNLYFTVESATIGYINNSGVFTSAAIPDTGDSGNLTDAEWSVGSATTTSYTLTPSLPLTFAGTATAEQVGVDMILIPHALTTATAYASGASGAAFEGAYIAVSLKIQNYSGSEDGAYIVGDESTYVTALWPLDAITWTPGYKYTYTVDLAGGGYSPTNTSGDSGLDPIIDAEGEIKFASVTVDGWTDAEGIAVPPAA